MAHPKGTHFIQNNFFRAYIRDDGRIELHADPSGRANYTDFLETTRRLITDDLLLIEDAVLHEVSIIEEAGVTARLCVRFEDETWMLSMVADSASLPIEIQRSKLTRTRVGLEIIDDYGRARGRFDSPTVTLHLEGIEMEPKRVDAGFEFECNQYFTLCIDLGDYPWRPAQIDLRQGETFVPNPGGIDGACAVRIANAVRGPYWVREDGSWMHRAIQPAREYPNAAYIKAYLSPDSQTAIFAGEWLEGAIAPGWGCQYILRFADVRREADVVSATVRVEDVNPLCFAPRVDLPFDVAAVRLDGDAWHYFDGQHVFLPNRRGEYRIEATGGRVDEPHVVSTFAVVRRTRWADGRLTVETALPPWIDCVPDGYRFRMVVRTVGKDFRETHGCTVTRRDDHWIVIKFDPGGDLHFVTKDA